jgi:tetratricopeptide (TPR) repeat protein
MLRGCFEAGALFLPTLWKGEVPIGVVAAFVDERKRSLVAFIVGRDKSITKPSPGFVLHLHSIRWAIQRGFTTYDLQTGNFSYKYGFGSVEHRVECLRVSTRSGRNIGEKLNRRSVPVAFRLTTQLAKNGKLVEAERGCRQILAVESDHVGALQLLEQLKATRSKALAADFDAAFAFHQRGQLAEAEQMYRSILQADPQHFHASHLLGVIFSQRGEFEAAERQISLAIRISPGNVAAHFNRGHALRGLSRFAESLESYDRAISLKPDYAEAFFYRGVVLHRLNQVREALASYAKAIELKPDFAQAVSTRHSLLADLGRMDKAGRS